MPGRDSGDGKVPGLTPVGLSGACRVALYLPEGFFSAPTQLRSREREAMMAALGDDENGVATIEAAVLPLLRRRGRPESTLAGIIMLLSVVLSAVGPLVVINVPDDGRSALLYVVLWQSIVVVPLFWVVRAIGDRLRRGGTLPLQAEVLENLNALRFERRPRGVSFRVAGGSNSAFANLEMEVAAPVAPASSSSSSSPSDGDMAGVAASLPPWASLGPNETMASRRLVLDDARGAALGVFCGSLCYTSSHPRTSSLIARVDLGVTDGDMAAFIDSAEAIIRNNKSPGIMGALFLSMPMMLLMLLMLVPGISATLSTIFVILGYAGVMISVIAGGIHARRAYNRNMAELSQLADEWTARHARARFHVGENQVHSSLVFSTNGRPPTLSLSAKADTVDGDNATTIIVTP